MGGTLGPLVQGSFISLHRRIRLTVLFTAAFVLGSLVTFTLASLLGELISPVISFKRRVICTAVGLVLLSINDAISIHNDTYCSLSLRRQTPKILLRRHGVLAAAAVWGFDLGIVVSTFRVASATWGILMMVSFGWVTPWSALLYSTGFLAPLLFLMWTGRLPAREPEKAAASLSAMIHRRVLAQGVSAGLLALGAILIALGD